MTVKPLQTAIENKVNLGQKAFIPYIMAGDGGLKAIRKQILFLQDAGATAIEVGIPFTDLSQKISSCIYHSSFKSLCFF